MHMPRPCLAILAWAVACQAMAGGSAGTDAQAANEVAYRVQPGDNAWRIAQRYLQHAGQALALASANRIADPRRLKPGTLLHIPVAWLREQPAPVRVVAVSGDVVVRPEGTPPRRAEAGDVLRAPARLETGTQGSASLEFSDGSRALLLRDSELLVRNAGMRLLDEAGMVSLDLLRGSLESAAQPRPRAGYRFEIHTPAAIAAVRGTRFRVHAAGDGPQAEARTEVLGGTVRFASAAGAVLAQASQGSLARAGVPPDAPTPLLPPTPIDALPRLVEQLPGEWAFAPQAGAVAYHVQLALDAGFDSVVLDRHLPTPQLRLPVLPDGRYWMRLRGIDDRGLQGQSAEQALQVRTQPAPPLTLEPAGDARLAQERPQFRWTQADGSAGYRLQLFAQDAAEPLLDARTDGGQFQPQQALPLGRYRWRVATMGADGLAGPFGAAQQFERVPPGPLAALAGGDGPPMLRWSAQAGATGYRIELAPAAEPSAPVLDQQVDGPQCPLPPLPPGAYRVRVQAIGADGVPGPWSQPQRFTVPDPASAPWPLLLLLPLVLL